MTISAVVMVLQVVLISRVWSQTPSPALASVSDRNLHDLIIFEGVVGMTAIHIPFSIDLSQFFAYLIVNNSRVDATVTAGSGDSNISIQLPDRHGVKDFLSTHPDYDSIVRKACKTGICEFRLSLAVTSDPAPLQILVQAMQGTNLSPGVDVHGRIEKPGQFRMYGR
uniref:Uncharacterized protein n=1 Tax=Spongospora subterranea TaxID=70186 RepID=A0A0H5REA8_9EUKA|eukprot:CRZ12096.1 hypothetical protein [Spongospora subterranea]